MRKHEFRYRLAMAYIDLDELPTLLGGRLARARPGLVRFRRSDYLGDPHTPLADAVRARVEQERSGTGRRARSGCSPTCARFGHCFNPVSFYYCFAPDGETLEAVVAEVTNTPWGERHAYVLAAASGDMDKALHVSPFMPMDQRYTWRAPAPGETLSVHIESRQDGRLAFDATLGTEAPAAHRAARSPRPPAPTLRDARPHLRPRGRAEAQGRPRPTPPRAMTETLARKIAMGILGRIRVGQLTVIEDDRETVFGSGAPQATVHIHSTRRPGRSSCAAAAAWARPTWTACGTRPTSPR